MSKTAVGLYETSTQAQEVVKELVEANFDRSNVHLILSDSDNGQLREWRRDQPNWDGNGGARFSDGATATLISMGVPRSDARGYEQALHDNHALVSISTSDGRIDDAVEIMNRHEIIDYDDHRHEWDRGTTATRDIEGDEETTVPVVEEDVQVGKREVKRGGVRISTHVTETPVDETVNLREEHVHVDRHSVDRPADDADLAALGDKTIEVSETDEEAVVNKQARVVEEVTVNKDVETREEHVRDTVRRTDVDVEEIDPKEWDRHRNDFHTHYTNTYADRGRAFSEYEPAYRYGATLARQPQYRDRDWNDIEPEARRAWEARNRGTWGDYKDAIRQGWQRVRR